LLCEASLGRILFRERVPCDVKADDQEGYSGKSVFAKALYAILLIQGACVEQNVNRGKHLLSDAEHEGCSSMQPLRESSTPKGRHNTLQNQPSDEKITEVIVYPEKRVPDWRDNAILTRERRNGMNGVAKRQKMERKEKKLERNLETKNRGRWGMKDMYDGL
jgi:hypothetical protein